MGLFTLKKGHYLPFQLPCLRLVKDIDNVLPYIWQHTIQMLGFIQLIKISL